MRGRSVRKVIAGALLATASALTSCAEPGAPSGGASLLPQEPPEAVELENSGRTLSGLYTLAGASPPVVAARMTFTADGEYTREVSVAGSPTGREEAGSYVVDRQERLVLWVESVGEQRFTSARPIFFGLRGDPATEIELVTSDGRVERYARAGDAPPRAARRF